MKAGHRGDESVNAGLEWHERTVQLPSLQQHARGLALERALRGESPDVERILGDVARRNDQRLSIESPQRSFGIGNFSSAFRKATPVNLQARR